jgi:stage V sporulation protein R
VSITPELARLAEQIAVWAKDDYGLDFWETRFELVSWDTMNELAAFEGFPVRYPHWRFGMEYERLSKSYAYGLQKIYEMVINTRPSYAYLLEGNMMVDHKTVIAHVYGHVDFFKNNFFFSKTNRKMLDEMANHASRVRRLIDKHGLEEVEKFIDVCLTLDNLIDIHSPYIRRDANEEIPLGSDPEVRSVTAEIPQIEAERGYMRSYLNPDDFVAEQRARLLEERRQKEERFPSEPARDILGFLIEHAPLKRWQLELLEIVQEETYYFAPQRQTKIMNEGWASFWHSRIMTQKALTSAEVIDYADHHAGTLATTPGSLNPYKVGIELFRDIEERWDRGAFGKEWEECDDLDEKARWDRNLGQGREKIFQVRKLYNDATFIDTFLTPEFCARHKLFTFAYNRRADQWEIASKEFEEIKRKLMFQLTNFGQPVVVVEHANYKNRGELLLLHRYEGVDLKTDYVQSVLQALFRLWRRPVSLQTSVEGKAHISRFDGEDHSEESED